MLLESTKSFLVAISFAIFFGYWYNSLESETADPNLVSVSLEDLNNIQWKTMDKNLSAFVLGATGAIGKELVKVLANDARFSRVTLIGRRPVTLNAEENPGYQKFKNEIVDFEKLEDFKEVFKGYHVGFSSLGTTRRKSGAQGFYRVDHDYVVETAKLAKDGGCQHLHLVSSKGANKDSWFLYTKTKGQVEAELSEMGFPRLSIYRPGLLLFDGGRGQETRFDEALLQNVLRPLDKKRWLCIDVPMFAKVMVANCFREGKPGNELLDNAALNKFIKELPAENQVENMAGN